MDSDSMNRPLAAVWLVALVAVFAIFAVSMHEDNPEPFALPPTMPVTAISNGLGATNGTVYEVRVINLPTDAPAATYDVPVTPTPGVPFCPVKPGQVCQIPPAVVVVTPTEPIICDATALALMNPGVVCEWRIAPTFVPTPTPGGFYK
jgi:hypothetical protein